tara:strand:+ start:3478 stop:4137 length:660 start_codon:yes stop_codon:yes gene_type:complete
MAGVRPENLSVSDIKGRLLNIAQTSHYRLTLSVPDRVRSRLSDLGAIDYDNISLLCSEANLPGSSLATHEALSDYQGVSEKMAYRRIYDESFGLTFYVDRSYNVIKVFERWIDYISGVRDPEKYKSPYIHKRVAFPNRYKTDIYLTKFEKDHFAETTASKTTLDYTFVESFPRDITAIPVSYDQSQLLRCNVNFSFIRYVVEENITIQTNEVRDPIVTT